MSSRHTTPLPPRDGELFAVRWRTHNGTVKHTFYRRRADAEARLARLRAWGKTVHMYRTRVVWEEQAPRPDSSPWR